MPRRLSERECAILVLADEGVAAGLPLVTWRASISCCCLCSSLQRSENLARLCDPPTLSLLLHTAPQTAAHQCSSHGSCRWRRRCWSSRAAGVRAASLRQACASTCAASDAATRAAAAAARHHRLPAALRRALQQQQRQQQQRLGLIGQQQQQRLAAQRWARSTQHAGQHTWHPADTRHDRAVRAQGWRGVRSAAASNPAAAHMRTSRAGTRASDALQARAAAAAACCNLLTCGRQVVLMADGQISSGSRVVKPNARKLRRLAAHPSPPAVAGFAGSTADALTLFERLEGRLEEHPGQLRRAAVELAKAWRQDRVLRHLEVRRGGCLRLCCCRSGGCRAPHVHACGCQALARLRGNTHASCCWPAALLRHACAPGDDDHS